MPQPAKFESRTDLISQLRDYDWREKLKQISEKHKSTGLLGAIHFSVMGSTFRAFRRNKSKEIGPAKVFRNWAVEKLYKGFLPNLLQVHSQAEYDLWLGRFTGTLRRAWETELG